MWFGHREGEKVATTLGLRAPELIEGNYWDTGIDIWSAGCVVSLTENDSPENIQLTIITTSYMKLRPISLFLLLQCLDEVQANPSMKSNYKQ
jgi:serine/threonine protein kinase